MALGRRSVHTAATWLDNSASVVVDVPVESCYDMWSDRTRIPQWMPWIHSVEVRRCF